MTAVERPRGAVRYESDVVERFLGQVKPPMLASSWGASEAQRESAEQEMSYATNWVDVESPLDRRVDEPLSRLERLGLELGRIQCLVRRKTNLDRGVLFSFVTGSDLDGKPVFMTLRCLRTIPVQLGYVADVYHSLCGFPSPAAFRDHWEKLGRRFNWDEVVEVCWVVDP